MSSGTSHSRRIRIITPVPVPAEAHSLFREQVPATLVRAGTELEFDFAREGGFLIDSYYDSALASVFVLEAAQRAEADGCDAVCIMTVTDTGLDAARSRLSIPVVGAGLSTFLLACDLGDRFSIISLWDRWRPAYKKNLLLYGLDGHLASIRDIDTHPNLEELLTGKEEVVFEALEKEAQHAIQEDGAEVIILGSTTMYQSHEYLRERLDVPVINPASVAYLACESLLDLSLMHSRAAYIAPENFNDGLLQSVPSRYPDSGVDSVGGT